MRDDDIDSLLNQASAASPNVDPALLDRISASLGASIRPVRPLPPSWLLVAALMAACLAVAAAGGVLLGLHGIQKMGALEMALIFPSLGALTWLTAVLYVSEMIPGSTHPIAPQALTAAGSLVLIAAFALAFRDYQTERFVPQGIKCLTTGLLHAVPAAVAGWWLLRRGFAVDSIRAGIARGALAGLAGVAMLELHCSNFEAPHVMLWHTAVLPLSAAAGALVAWFEGNRRSRFP